MPTLTIHPPADGDWRKRFLFEVEGSPPIPDSFGSTTARKALAKLLGIALPQLSACVAKGPGTYAEAEQLTAVEEIKEKTKRETDEAASLAAAAPVPVRIRGRRSGISITYCDLQSALQESNLPDEALIEWDGTERLAALDVDFHQLTEEQRPSDESLDAVLHLINPAPVYCWLTHGRGIRCMYRGSSRHTAAEFAAAGFLSIRRLYPIAEGEIKHATRHPASVRDNRRCGPVRPGTGSPDLSHLAAQLRGERTQEDAVEKWLDEHGMKRGGRYPHDLCPLAPSSQGGREPVWVGDRGVHCHYCAGTTGRGFISWQKLCGDVTISTLGAMVRGRVHWGHAKYLFEALFDLRGTIAEQCYRAALKMVHEEADECFAGSLHLLRLQGTWATGDGRPLNNQIRGLLSELPAAISPGRVDEFLQTTPLDRHGYFELSPVWGCKIAGVHQQTAAPDSSVDVVFFPLLLQLPHMEPYRPRYIPAKERGELPAAWHLLESAFPGLHRGYVTLLIVAKGCAEVSRGMPPMIFVTGPTGSAKTGAAQVAAAICGDTAAEVTWQANRERTRQGVLDAKSSGSFVVMNEVLKEGRAAGLDTVSTMDFILNLSSTSSSHKMYVGHVMMGRLPVFVWTDTGLPDDLAADSQLARRLVHVELPSRVEWETSMIATGVNVPTRVRLAGEHWAEACNVILSDIIDAHFREPSTFSKIAAKLGFPTLLDATAPEKKIRLREFFDAVCQAPSFSSGADYQRFGVTWKEIRSDQETPLSKLWGELSRNADGTVRQLQAEDWQRVLSSPQPVKCEVKTYGRRTFVRFTGRRHDLSMGRNEELLPPNELEPVLGVPDRLGDAVDSGPFAGFPSLS